MALRCARGLQVRFDVLRDFFKRAPNALVRHKLCDLAFTSDFKRGGEIERFTPTDASEFVYWYSRPDNAPYQSTSADADDEEIHHAYDGSTAEPPAGASNCVDVGASDRELARNGHAAVVRALGPDTPPDLQFSEDRLAFFLSALRQAIEQELVQLRIASATPKLAQTDDVCSRQLDLLLADHPLRGSRPFDRLREWCLQCAKGPILQSLLRLLAFDLPRSRGRGR